MKKVLPYLYFLAAAIIAFGGAATLFEKKQGSPVNFHSSYQSGTFTGYGIGLILCGLALAAAIRFILSRTGRQVKAGYALMVLYVVTFFTAIFYILPADVLKLYFK